MQRRLFVALVLVFTASSGFAQLGGDPAVGLTTDFRNWLTANGYASYNFPHAEISGGSYGGRTVAGQALAHDPVIFIHGNSDSALGYSSSFTGWASPLAYLKS